MTGEPHGRIAEAAQVIVDDLGRPLAEVFASFDAAPVASASISQVHRATLKDGTAVAVKVQRPEIAAVIDADIELLGSVFHWIAERGIQTPGFDPVGTVEELSRSVWREPDFLHEARTVERFARNFRGCDTVHFPTIYPDLSATRVLTMEWIAGMSLGLKQVNAEGFFGSPAAAAVPAAAPVRQTTSATWPLSEPRAGGYKTPLGVL